VGTLEAAPSCPTQAKPSRCLLPLPVWVGHSCPTPLTLMLPLTLTGGTPFSRAERASETNPAPAEGRPRREESERPVLSPDFAHCTLTAGELRHRVSIASCFPQGAKAMAKRTRITTTIREDDPVPRRSSKKKSNALLIVILMFLLLFIWSRTQHSVVSHPIPATTRH